MLKPTTHPFPLMFRERYKQLAFPSLQAAADYLNAHVEVGGRRVTRYSVHDWLGRWRPGPDHQATICRALCLTPEQMTLMVGGVPVAYAQPQDVVG